MTDGSGDVPRVLSRVEDPTGRTLTLTLDDGATFEVALNTAEAQALRPGDPVPAELADLLAGASERKEIARAVFKLLDRRLFTRAQLRERLTSRGFDGAATDLVLESFAAQGLVDDAHTAAAYCRDQLARRPVGPNYLRQKLRALGIDAQGVDQALRDAYPPGRQEELAAAALRKRGLRRPEDQDKALRFLWSRGFSRAVAAQAIHDARTRAREERAGSD